MDEVVKSIPSRETAVVEVDFNEDVVRGTGRWSALMTAKVRRRKFD